MTGQQETIPINMNVVDLGRIDLLVEQGFYTNRAEFIRGAVTRSLDLHQSDLKRLTNVNRYVVGVTRMGRADLEAFSARNERLRLHVVGMVVIDGDVSPALAEKTIEAVRVRGVLRVTEEVRAALADRMA
jgi:Arc/MetJ-type ribon-helix-helix transcriptional regulator